jgi:hypothetical protein
VDHSFVEEAEEKKQHVRWLHWFGETRGGLSVHEKLLQHLAEFFISW